VQYVDRNGNTLTYNTTTSQWTDTLGRTIKAIPLSNGTAGDVDYLMPGVGGVDQKYILRWKHLGDSGVLTTPQPLRFKGRYKYTWTAQTISPYLFSGVLSDRIVDDGTPGSEFNPIVLAEIILPNSQSSNVLSYKFTYNVWGEVEKVSLPSGGYERFEYASVPSISDINVPYTEGNRGAIKHWISATGNAVDEVQWTYASTGTVTSVTNPSGSRAERTLIAASINTHYGFEDSRTGRAGEERTYNASNQMIRRTLVEWVQDGPLPGGHAEATRNPRGTKKVEVILDTTGNALAATTTSTYDADLNEIKTDHYDYVSVSQSTGQTAAISSFPLGALLRTTETTYLVNDTAYTQTVRDAYRAQNMLGLPTKKIVKNGAGQVVAATEYKYDETAYPLLTYATVSGWANPSTTYRGNVTTARSWNNNGNQAWAGWTSGSWIETHTQYDQCGNPRNNWDGKGYLAQIEYTDAFSDSVNRNTYAYPTKTISPVPDPTGSYGLTTSLIAQTKYDFSTGKVTWVQDANNQVATTEYEGVLGSGYNSLNRITRVVPPTGGGETVYEYNDTVGTLWVKTRTKRDASNWIESVSFLDKLGRAYLSATNEGSNSWAISETKFDSLGRANQSANPYRVTSTTVDGIPAAAAAITGKQWTTSTFDALNRALTITTPDNAVVTSFYEINQVTVTDPAGKNRKSETDALGRLTKVWENPTGLNYLTSYSYDVLDNLTTVAQGVQTRTFAYDSLKRLTSATNPESGTTYYTYDNNGNLKQKTDALGRWLYYNYDALNRHYESYSNQAGTHYRLYYYDTAPKGKGRLSYTQTNTWYAGLPAGQFLSQTVIEGYDELGRPLGQRQQYRINNDTQWSAAYTTARTYDLEGNVKSQTYPSGRVVNYSYNNAGQLSSFTGNLGDGVSRTYVSSASYSPAGQVERESYGTQTPLYLKRHYNVRQQLVDLRLGSVNDEWNYNRGALIFYYGTNAVNQWNPFADSPDNNGNLRRTVNYVPTGENGAGTVTSHVIPQLADYTYDEVNRITSYTEAQQDGNGGWHYNVAGQTFSYDRYGNRQITATLGGVNGYNPSYHASTNRIVGLTYDAVGNLTQDGTKTMGYDANNKLVSATMSSGTASYLYDAQGSRVSRTVNGVTTWQIYGLEGELVAEYAAGGTLAQKEYGYRGGQMLVVCDSTVTGDKRVQWLVQDHLGSTRLVADVSGLWGVGRQDYLPFGEDLSAGIRQSGGQGQYGYEPPASNVRQKFTGYERDNETGLDFAQARYMSSVQGRFTSVDPDGIGAAITEPQSWNGYAYVGNRPTTLTDPSGLLWVYNERTGDLYWSDLTRAQWEAKYGNLKHWKILDGTVFKQTRDVAGWKKGFYYLTPNVPFALYLGNGAKAPIADISGLRDNAFTPFFLFMISAYTTPISAAAGASSVMAFGVNLLKDLIVDAAVSSAGDALVAADLDLAKRTAIANAAVMKSTGVRDGTTTAYVEDGMVYVGHSIDNAFFRLNAEPTEQPRSQHVLIELFLRLLPLYYEPRALSAAEQAGASGRGGAIATANNWNGKLKPACPSCSVVLSRRGIKF
jgi:RHS repeat-associated protein